MDISNLLTSLNARRVRYGVIGATAFPTHGFVRMTGDIDLLIAPTAENAERTWQALSDVGYDVTDLPIQDLLRYKVLIRQYVLATDIHPFAKGVRFETVWKNRVKDTIEGVPVFVASLDDLFE